MKNASEAKVIGPDLLKVFLFFFLRKLLFVGFLSVDLSVMVSLTLEWWLRPIVTVY